MGVVTVREYARLTTQSLSAQDAARPLDRACISASAFDWLCDLSARMKKSGASLVQAESRTWLRLDNYVGVITTPCGTTLEIVPKHYETEDSLKKSRELLRRLILQSMDLPTRVTDRAQIELYDAPLSEWLIARFLAELDKLVKRGLKFEYQRVEEEALFLRGQLDVSRQLRQPPGRQHVFQIRHDLHLPDRPENRLLKLALEKVRKATHDPRNWHLAHELQTMMHEVPASKEVDRDFQHWSQGRLLASYRAIRPWCQLVLAHQVPMALSGHWEGISLLFPMEKLFERCVSVALRKLLSLGAALSTPARSKYLCIHESANMFRMEPDMLVAHAGEAWVLDSKWKRLKGGRDTKYGLSQSDFYQLFAYGHRYMDGKGKLFLVYPRTDDFEKSREFDFHNGMTLRTIPFDIDSATFDLEDIVALPLRLRVPD